MTPQTTNLLTCPYCGYSSVASTYPHNTLNTGTHFLTEPLLVLPYARDIGPFDPQNETGHGEWTRIGKDFLGFLGYELFGILRWEANQRVYYRVGRCTNCQCLFDVYANYTQNRTIADMWPHLVGRSPNTGQIIKTRPDLLWWKFIASTPLLVLVLIIIYALSFLSQILIFSGEYYGGQQLMAFIGMYKGELIGRLVGVLAVLALFHISSRLTNTFSDIRPFARLFKIKNRDGVTYWTNFAISRFIGVPRGEKIIALNASMIFGGGISTLLLLSCWLQSKLGWQGLLYWYIFLPIPFLTSYSFYYFLEYILIRIRRVSSAKKWHILLFSLKPRTTLQLSGLITGLILWFSSPLIYLTFFVRGTVGLLHFTELLFWVFVSFQMGTGVWNATAVSLYILNGATRIPMNLDPRHSFEELTVLAEVGRLANLGLSTLIATAIFFGLSPILVIASGSINWITTWMQVSLIYLYAIILSRTRRQTPIDNAIRICFLLAIFVFVKIAFGAPSHPGWLVEQIPFLQMPFLATKQMYQYVELILVGMLSTHIVYTQSTSVNNTLRALKETSKKKLLLVYKALIRSLEKELAINIYKGSKGVLDTRSRNDAIHAIDRASRVFQSIEQAPTDPLAFRRAVEIALPFVTTVIFPVFLDWLIP